MKPDAKVREALKMALALITAKQSDIPPGYEHETFVAIGEALRILDGKRDEGVWKLGADFFRWVDVGLAPYEGDDPQMWKILGDHCHSVAFTKEMEKRAALSTEEK